RSPAQDDVAVWVPSGRRDRRAAALSDRHEVMWPRSRQDCVHGHLDVASSTILEANRAGEARSHFAMHLAFRGPGTDGRPGHQVRYVLGCRRVEELAAGGYAKISDSEQQPSGYAQPAIDVEGSIEARIVDEALPSHRCAGLFEIHPHDDFEFLP